MTTEEKNELLIDLLYEKCLQQKTAIEDLERDPKKDKTKPVTPSKPSEGVNEGVSGDRRREIAQTIEKAVSLGVIKINGCGEYRFKEAGLGYGFDDAVANLAMWTGDLQMIKEEIKKKEAQG